MDFNDNIVAAIDIGTTKIVAIIGRKNNDGKIDILGYGNAMSTGVRRGMVLNIDQTVNAIRLAVDMAQNKAGLSITDAYVGIAGQHIRSIRNRGYILRDSYDEEISKDDVQALIDDMYKVPIEVGEQIIHVLPQNFIVDNETGVKNPVGMYGKRFEANFHIVIGDIAASNNIKKCVNRVGVNVKNLVLEPLASADAVLTDDEKEIGVALVDIGGGTTDVAVFYDGIIRHTAVIPFGGNVVTQDIRQGCNILERFAEQLKIQYGSALVDKSMDNKVVSIPGISGRPPKEISFANLASIIQCRMEEIIAQVYFQIEASGFLQNLGAGIVITGGGALLKNLSQLVAFKTGMDVRLGLPNQNIINKADEQINQPTYATGLGLVLIGFDNNHGCCVEKIKPKTKPETEVTSLPPVDEPVTLTSKKNTAKQNKNDKKPKIATLFDKLGGFFDYEDEQM